MLFNTLQFAAFFAVVLAGYRLLPKSAQNAWLVAASLLFYSLWIPVYLLLLLADAGINYALMRAMTRSRRPFHLLVASVSTTLGILAFYKYGAFFASSIAPLSNSLFGITPPAVDLLLPLGISFYSFQIIALNVDVYRGDIAAPKNFARYLLFVSFFPQLIAGPILRGSEFLPQLARGGEFSAERTRRGLWLIASGLTKKVIFGDFLLAPFVNEVYGNPGISSAPVHLIATYSFAFQIYFDFSGYTDMARGMACLFGFELPYNFTEPYLSRNPSEFWRRWHMTLSRWLRDYLYIPLGGNRGSAARTYVNLMLTMLLGGLWHGAGWNFVVWGGFHGLLLAVHRRFAGRRRVQDPGFRSGDVARVFFHFHAVCLLWIFFRAATFEDAFLVLERLFTGSYAVSWPILPGLIVVACFALHVVERRARLALPRIRDALGYGPIGRVLEAAALGAVTSLTVLASGTGAEFIYFQF
jgi:alginate O-acetyltransferase complex protein AlgI